MVAWIPSAWWLGFVVRRFGGGVPFNSHENQEFKSNPQTTNPNHQLRLAHPEKTNGTLHCRWHVFVFVCVFSNNGSVHFSNYQKNSFFLFCHVKEAQAEVNETEIH